MGAHENSLTTYKFIDRNVSKYAREHLWIQPATSEEAECLTQTYADIAMFNFILACITEIQSLP